MTGDPAAEPTGGDETRVEAPDTVPLAQVAPKTPAPDKPGSESAVPAMPAVPSASSVPPVPAVPSSAVPSSDGGGGHGQASYGPPSYASSGYGQPGFGGPGYPGPAYSAPGYGQAGMRAAAADRERTLDVLKAAYGEGRLTRDEFEARTARTMAARYYGDLTAIVADLPNGPFGHPIAYQPQGYYPVVQVPPTNGLAVGALVCGILEFFTLGVASIPAVILGHMAHGQIKRTGERGDGMAITGMVLGWMAIAGWALFFIVLALRP